MKLKLGDVFFLIPLLVYVFSPSSLSHSAYVKIYSESGEYLFPLAEDRVFKIKGHNGLSTVEIRDGRVRMLDSACPLKLCVRQGWISKAGEKIICVPNRVVIEIVGENSEGLDAITE